MCYLYTIPPHATHRATKVITIFIMLFTPLTSNFLVICSKQFPTLFENIAFANNPTENRTAFIRVVVFGFEPKLFTITKKY